MIGLMRLTTAIAIVTLSASASAATAICAGTVSSVGIHTPGLLAIGIGTGPAFIICNVETVQFRQSTTACRQMLAVASTAYALRKNVLLYVDNAPTTNCADIPAWFVADTRYLEAR